MTTRKWKPRVQTIANTDQTIHKHTPFHILSHFRDNFHFDLLLYPNMSWKKTTFFLKTKQNSSTIHKKNQKIHLQPIFRTQTDNESR